MYAIQSNHTILDFNQVQQVMHRGKFQGDYWSAGYGVTALWYYSYRKTCAGRKNASAAKR